MFDFCTIKTKTKVVKDVTTIQIYPEFLVGRHDDLLTRGGAFYAVWDEDNGTWSKDPTRVCEVIDDAMSEKARGYDAQTAVDIQYMRNFSSNQWVKFDKYCKTIPDSYTFLDREVTFKGETVTKGDYRSKRLPYDLTDNIVPTAYDELMAKLYSPVQRQKLEWGVGAIFAGDSSKIQKFFVLYGDAGSGKSTFLHILEQLFPGYSIAFDAKALGTSSNQFSMEAFRDDPLIAIEHDGDLSHLDTNTRLNSIVSHEPILMNEKRKTQYPIVLDTLLFIGTNSPVRITDSKSGLLRRLIDVTPTGDKFPIAEYAHLMSMIPFELGAIASHCLDVYKTLGKSAYDMYRPLAMMGYTNEFYSFIEDNFDTISKSDYVTLTETYRLYKLWCEETGVKHPLSRQAVKSELASYFRKFYVRKDIDGAFRRNVYVGFNVDKVFGTDEVVDRAVPEERPALALESTVSLFDSEYATLPAQLAGRSGSPAHRWKNVDTTLADIPTEELHYVRVPENHIVIDFDIPGDDGGKSLSRNLEAAAKFPPTYAELSKSGKGVHLHYIYDGDPSELASKYADHIEIKVFTGNASLRRKLTRCNNHSVAHILSGLPLKGEGKKNVVDFEGVYNEKALRTLIRKNLKKVYHPGTKPSVEFIKQILDECYDSGVVYDVSDMKPAITSFASNSTNHSSYCLQLVTQMKFVSEEALKEHEWPKDEIVFYDVEVFPNLFIVVWKAAGEDKEPVKMVNPTSEEIEELCRMKLVGFNCRRYDNHILYARMLGYSNADLYKVSQKLITSAKDSTFREAYSISYTDVYDFSSKKQSLKKFEIDLGIHHQELGLPWDEPVPEDLWGTVADYCINDVVATEAVFNARHDDFVARELLAEISGLTVNDTNRAHATRIIFGSNRHPQTQFVYTDLSEMFPGYSYDAGKSRYRGEIVGEGGYVYAEPGMYENVVTLDVESMHPNSIINLNLFGTMYTNRFKELLDTRLAIKHKDFAKARTMFDGRLAKYLTDEASADRLSYALKIIINSVYGLTSAKFDCEFKDPRNVDNIVAKRGALFMVNLKHEVQERGFTVAHIKTDSIKIPNPTPEILDFVRDYGEQYGYHFEIESEYDRFCLVNDAVYIAKEKSGRWQATGAQFKQKYVFKTLFSKEPLEFEDYCETKAVSGDSVMYLDKNEDLSEDEHDYIFVGRAGAFCPILPGAGGGLLLRTKGDKYYAVNGTKGWRWMEAEVVRLMDMQDKIDMTYFEKLVEEAISTISKYGDFEWFVKGAYHA